MARPVVLRVLHPVEQSRAPRVPLVRGHEIRTLAEGLRCAGECHARSDVIVIPRELYGPPSEVQRICPYVPRHGPVRTALVHVVAFAPPGGEEVRLAIPIERPTLAREGSVGGAGHVVPIERRRVARAAVHLPPRLDRVGAHEVLPPGAEFVALVQSVPEEGGQFGFALRLRSHDEYPLVDVIRVVIAHGIAESPVGVGKGGLGCQGLEYPHGEYRFARPLVAHLQPPPPVVRSRGRCRGYLGTGDVAAVAQAVDVARPVRLVGRHARVALAVGRGLGVVRIRQTLVGGGLARRFGGGASELGGDVGEFSGGGAAAVRARMGGGGRRHSPGRTGGRRMTIGEG